MESKHYLMKTIKSLIKIIQTLRDPEKGRSWELKQTHSSLIKYLLEEAHEVADAIRNGSDQDLKEELGDLLFQILLHAQIASEEKKFYLDDIAKELNTKLLKRHPNIFNNYANEESWESIKEKEESFTDSKTPLSDRISKKIRCQPALAGAEIISSKTAQAGFEWDSISGVWDKVHEEIEELKEAIENKDRENAQKELGDVLFALVNIARWCNISAEEGLSGTNRRFLDRFSYIEMALEGQISNYSISELQKQWQMAKVNLGKAKNKGARQK